MADLPMEDVEGARRLLDLLESANWLDGQTRALFIEFSLYLPSADLLLAARLIIEVHASGTTWTDSSLEPVSLAVYRSSNRLQMAVQILTAVTALVAIVWEIWHTAILRMHHGLRAGSVRPWSLCSLPGGLMHLSVAMPSLGNAWRVQTAAAPRAGVSLDGGGSGALLGHAHRHQPALLQRLPRRPPRVHAGRLPRVAPPRLLRQHRARLLVRPLLHRLVPPPQVRPL